MRSHVRRRANTLETVLTAAANKRDDALVQRGVTMPHPETQRHPEEEEEGRWERESGSLLSICSFLPSVLL